jgi:hypothetical protein
MGTKKTKFNKTGIENLPNNKPAVYKILTSAGKVNYAGVAKRGRVQERLNEHLGEIPGATVLRNIMINSVLALPGKTG